ncbi:MAG: hypothetical protein WC100_19360 [Sterolibacterium sp.]
MKMLNEPSALRFIVYRLELHRAYGNKLSWYQAMILRLFTTGKFPTPNK